MENKRSIPASNIINVSLFACLVFQIVETRNIQWRRNYQDEYFRSSPHEKNNEASAWRYLPKKNFNFETYIKRDYSRDKRQVEELNILASNFSIPPTTIELTSSFSPTRNSSLNSTYSPSHQPTFNLTFKSSYSNTSLSKTYAPSLQISFDPSHQPTTSNPSITPSIKPSMETTLNPSLKKSSPPSIQTPSPTGKPTVAPTLRPTDPPRNYFLLTPGPTTSTRKNHTNNTASPEVSATKILGPILTSTWDDSDRPGVIVLNYNISNITYDVSVLNFDCDMFDEHVATWSIQKVVTTDANTNSTKGIIGLTVLLNLRPTGFLDNPIIFESSTEGKGEISFCVTVKLSQKDSWTLRKSKIKVMLNTTGTPGKVSDIKLYKSSFEINKNLVNKTNDIIKAYQCDSNGEKGDFDIFESNVAYICVENENSNPILDIKELSFLKKDKSSRFSAIANGMGNALTAKWPIADRGKKWIIKTRIPPMFFQMNRGPIEIDGSVVMAFNEAFLYRRLQSGFNVEKSFIIPEMYLAPRGEDGDTSSGRSSLSSMMISFGCIALRVTLMIFLGYEALIM